MLEVENQMKANIKFPLDIFKGELENA